MSKTSNRELVRLRQQYISDGVGSASTRFVDHARGAILVDIEGKEHIDFAGGIGVLNVGHSHPRVIEAIKQQADHFLHTCFMINPYESAVRLAEELCAITPGDFPKKAVFLNSGAEAVENAVKIARY